MGCYHYSKNEQNKQNKTNRQKKTTNPKKTKTKKTKRLRTIKKLNQESTDVDFPGGAVVKIPLANAGDTGSSPGPGRSHVLQSN